MLKENDVKIITCADCGAIINVDENGNIIPIEEMVKNDDYIINNLGEYVCSECMEDYTQCEDCGDWIPTDDGYWVGEYEDHFVCEDCFDDNYIKCEDCGKYFLEEDLTYIDGYCGGYYVCYDCRIHGDYGQCPDCERWFYYEDMRYSESDGYDYCEECYPYHENELIMDYHDFNDWEVYGEHGITKGFELEISTDNRNDVVQDIHDILDDFVVFENDGSINGVEMITNPFTRDYWDKKSVQDDIKNVFDVLKEHGCGTNGCGLHVHVNRSQLATDTLSSDDVIDNIIIIMETFKNELTKFSRRTKSALNDWASFLTDDNETLTFKAIKDKKRCAGRYVALNLSNRKTIEFRIFKSTMKYNELMATLELVDNIVDIARKGNVDGLTWNDIVNFHGDFIQDYVNGYNITSDRVLTVVQDSTLGNVAVEVEQNSDFQVGDIVTIDDSINVGSNRLSTREHYQIVAFKKHEDSDFALIYHEKLVGHSGTTLVFNGRFIGNKYDGHLWYVDVDYLHHVLKPFANVSELNIGDRVYITDNLERKTYGSDSYLPNIMKRGIVKVSSKEDNYNKFRIGDGYNYTPEMCDGIIVNERVDL